MSISRVAFWSHALRSCNRLQNKSPQRLHRCVEAGGEHHEHQPGSFLSHALPKLRTLAKPFAPVIAQMRRGGRRAS